MPVAIQTNAWLDRLHRSDLPLIIEQIACAGYDALEIGAHRLDLDNPAAFSDLLAQHGLIAAGIHTHGEIFAPAEMRARLEFFEKAIRFARAIHASCMIVSGKAKDGKTETDLFAEVASLHWLADLCREQEMPLCYHTHNWELVDNLHELRYLVSHTDPEKLSLALDIGWVQRAGHDPLQFIAEFYPRIGYLHLKDTRDGRWTEIGRGTVDFRALLAELKQRGFSGWLTVERDEELETAFESAKTSRKALRELGV